MTSYQNAVRLYDAEALLEVSPEVAHGYLVLLSSSSKEEEDASNSLAFVSLTDGNVLDACFGYHAQSKDTSTPAGRACCDAKAALLAASEHAISSSFNNLAVETYANAFQIVVDYHASVKKMNCCIRCFRQGSRREKAKRDLEIEFKALIQAVVPSTHSGVRQGAVSVWD